MEYAKVECAFKAHVDIYNTKMWSVEFVHTTYFGQDFSKSWSSTYWFHIDEARDANDAIGQARSRWLASRNPYIARLRDRWWARENLVQLKNHC